MIPGFVQRELDRIHAAICAPENANRLAELRAAQQALAWCLEPGGFRAPLASITGIQEAREDYPGQPHPVPFSDIRASVPSSQ